MTSECVRAEAMAYRSAANIMRINGHGHPFCHWFVGEFERLADQCDAKAIAMDDSQKTMVSA